jgi:hypothetical protein
MAKLSARGRHCVAAFIRTKEFAGPYHMGKYNSDFSICFEKENCYEYEVAQYRLMSDGHLLYSDKVKHFQHDKPFISGWKDKGKIENTERLLSNLLKLGYKQVEEK